MSLVEYVPAAHARHWLVEVIPNDVSYVPPAQGVHEMNPDPVVKLPAEHREQTIEAVNPDPELYVPAWHRAQLDEVGLPTIELYAPAWHRAQVAEDELPTVELYAPAWHGAHVGEDVVVVLSVSHEYVRLNHSNGLSLYKRTPMYAVLPGITYEYEHLS